MIEDLFFNPEVFAFKTTQSLTDFLDLDQRTGKLQSTHCLVT